MYKKDLVLNNLQLLICHETKQNHLRRDWRNGNDPNYSIVDIVLYKHEKLYIHICKCMQKHNGAMKMSGHRSLEKYTSHFIESVVCERELETEQNFKILTPQSYGHNSVSFPFSWAAQPGSWGPAFLGQGPHSSFFSPTATSQSGALGPPLLGAGSLYRILSPTNSKFLCTELHYCFTPTQFNLSTVKVIPLIPSTGCTCYLHRCISYFDSSAGVNMQQLARILAQKVKWK